MERNEYNKFLVKLLTNICSDNKDGINDNFIEFLENQKNNIPHGLEFVNTAAKMDADELLVSSISLMGLAVSIRNMYSEKFISQILNPNTKIKIKEIQVQILESMKIIRDELSLREIDAKSN